MGSQRVRHNLATKQQQKSIFSCFFPIPRQILQSYWLFHPGDTNSLGAGDCPLQHFPLSTLGIHHQTSQDFFPPNLIQCRPHPLRERQTMKEVLLGGKQRDSFTVQNNQQLEKAYRPRTKSKRRTVMPPGLGAGPVSSQASRGSSLGTRELRAKHCEPPFRPRAFPPWSWSGRSRAILATSLRCPGQPPQQGPLRIKIIQRTLFFPRTNHINF